MNNYILSILIVSNSVFAISQVVTSNYVGMNVFPIMSTTTEIGYEANPKKWLAYNVHAGYVHDSSIDSPVKVESNYDFRKRGGYFMKLGGRMSFRKKATHFAPFLGGNIVNAIAIERANPNEFSFSEPIRQSTYNLGVNITAGLTSGLGKRFGFDVGIQYGGLLIDNLLDIESFMPGMGVNLGNGSYIQGILRLKCSLK